MNRFHFMNRGEQRQSQMLFDVIDETQRLVPLFREQGRADAAAEAHEQSAEARYDSDQPQRTSAHALTLA